MPPNLDDCDRCRAEFFWKRARRTFDGLLGGGSLIKPSIGAPLNWRRKHLALRFMIKHTNL
jgi:hypothetical protein